MRPRILISGSDDRQINYVNAILGAGGEPCPCYLPPVDDSYDALLLAGGGDVEPARYGQANTASCDVDLSRDKTELALIHAYMAAGKPILGICRGHQIINVALGGDLIQDIGDVLRPFHARGGLPDDRVHPVRACEGSFLYGYYGAHFAVNSSHHQAVSRLGEGLRPVAWSESGFVEAMEHDALPIRCVQWHPERMSYARRRPDTVDGSFLFEWLAAAAQESRTP